MILKYKTWIGLVIFSILFFSTILHVLFPEYKVIFERAFHLICHGKAERSFWIFEQPMLLCARCASVFLSFSLSFLFLSSAYSKSKQILAFSLFTVGLDVLFELAGLYNNLFPIRIVTGTILGFSLANILFIPE